MRIHTISLLLSTSSPSSSHPQVVSSSSPMPGWRTVPSYSATMASAPCAATREQRSCRNPVPVTSCTALKPSGWPSPRWPKHCWARKRGKWRSTCTGRTVGPYAVCVCVCVCACVFCGEVENSYKFNLLSYYGFQEPLYHIFYTWFIFMTVVASLLVYSQVPPLMPDHWLCQSSWFVRSYGENTQEEYPGNMQCFLVYQALGWWPVTHYSITSR